MLPRKKVAGRRDHAFHADCDADDDEYENDDDNDDAAQKEGSREERSCRIDQTTSINFDAAPPTNSHLHNGYEDEDDEDEDDEDLGLLDIINMNTQIFIHQR